MSVFLADGSDLLIIDADTHRSEPWDLWTSQAPAKYKERVPQVQYFDGTPYWVFDGHKVSPAHASTAVDENMEKRVGTYYLSRTVYEVAPAASEVAPRLELMNKQGVWAQLVYPNAIGFGGQQLGNLGDPELRSLVAVMFNDVNAGLQDESRNRLFPMVVVPWWDVDFAVKEIHRGKELGFVGANMVADPQEFGLPDLSQSHWMPLFKALEETDMPLNFHVGASATQLNYHGTAPWPSLEGNVKTAVGSAMLFMGNGRILANFIFGGILERHPRLKLVSVESGIGWLPFFLQSLDYQLGELTPDMANKLSLKPSEYFRRQCAGCFWFENEGLLSDIEYLGDQAVLFESDFPHPTCFYPNPVERAMRVFEGQSDELKKKVFGGNAARIYNLPIPEDWSLA
jgi:predicted TIM-barrel fold metal-dependent hydrolase